MDPREQKCPVIDNTVRHVTEKHYVGQVSCVIQEKLCKEDTLIL